MVSAGQDAPTAPRAIGRNNRAAVRRWFAEHPCGTQRECAVALGLGIDTVGRHVKAIRACWRKDSQSSERKSA